MTNTWTKSGRQNILDKILDAKIFWTMYRRENIWDIFWDDIFVSIELQIEQDLRNVWILHH